MHSQERERLILEALAPTGFVTYRELETRLAASPATIRRDLTRLEGTGRLVRVHGGAKWPEGVHGAGPPGLQGTPFAQAITQNLDAKKAIGRAAAQMCHPGEGIMIDGGSTTLQMCEHLAGKCLQVLTNSLHIVDALLPQPDTRVLLPSGTVFREQNIVLAPPGEESMPRFHAPRLFMGAAAVAAQGVMQHDTILVAAERRFMDQAEEVILMVDSSKFTSCSGAIVCGLEEVDVLITDTGIPDPMRAVLKTAGIRLVIAR